ncbi:MAG: HPr family phosphocarrier protein [Actinomycetaceae bacterium]|nr:HPr family phosphocarrier protein [Actinomycetaceae bacterium]
MISKEATVAARNGLHARPAAEFSQAAADSGVDVTVEFNGNSADAASLLEVMSLGAKRGDVITLKAEDSAEKVLDELVALVESAENA